MLSDKQLAANRANAARSTGPRSPEGKAASAQNARKHGFTAAAFSVVCLEEAAEIEALRADLIELYHPINSQELFALERMAVAQQKLIRADRLEAGLFNNCMSRGATHSFSDRLKSSFEPPREVYRDFKFGHGFQMMARQPDGFQLFLRYQAQNERLYRRAVEDFDRIRKLRPQFAEMQNEPIFQDEPQPGQAFIYKPNEPTETFQHGFEAPLQPAAERAPQPAAEPAAENTPNEPISDPEPQSGQSLTPPRIEPVSAPDPVPQTDRPAARQHSYRTGRPRQLFPLSPRTTGAS